MRVTEDFHSMIEMNKYVEDNNIKSKDITYMGNFLNIHGYCLIHIQGNPIPSLVCSMKTI